MPTRFLWAAGLLIAAATNVHAANKDIALEQLGRFETGVFDEGAAEIVAHDPDTQQLFVINADAKTIDVLDISDPMAPTKVDEIDVADDIDDTGGVNSVAVKNGLVAVAVEHDDKQMPGWVALYDTAGNFLREIPAGALPDSLAFTPNGSYVVVANEGEPSDDYKTDPEGTVTVVDLRPGVPGATASTADFSAFEGLPLPAGMRAPRPFGATLSQDLEPEFVAISHDSKTAFVTLQENNAIAIVDIKSATVTDLVGLGTKDHSLPGNALDASNDDDAIRIENWPVHGAFMPDSIAAFKTKGKTYLITANEGDGRDYRFDATQEECEGEGLEYDDEEEECIAFTDETRVGDVELDPAAFPDFDLDELQSKPELGRLKMISTEGDRGDGVYESIYSFGGRSITIWDAEGNRVFDTGDTMETITAMAFPDDFNSTNDENGSFDDRSDDKGPEPEGVVVGMAFGRSWAFVGLERMGGIMVFDVTDPTKTRFVTYANNRDYWVGNDDLEAGEAGDLAPEGLAFISEEDSPIGYPLLVVGNEVSGTTTIWKVKRDYELPNRRPARRGRLAISRR